MGKAKAVHDMGLGGCGPMSAGSRLDLGNRELLYARPEECMLLAHRKPLLAREIGGI